MIIGIDGRVLMDEHYSGVSEYAFRLTDTFLKLNNSKHISPNQKNNYKLFYNSGNDLTKRLPNWQYKELSTRYTHIPNKIFNYLLEQTIHYPKIDKLLGGVDVFWAPHINFLSLSKQCRKIVTIHDLSFLRHPEFFSSRKNFWHRAINVKKLVRKFDRVIAVSENTKHDLIELCGVAADKISVVYSGISERFQEIKIKESLETKYVKEKYRLPERFILYLGNIEPRKNIIGLIQSFSRLRDENNDFNDVKLVIVGQKGWRTKEIFKEWKESFYRREIKFLDYVNDEEKVYLYNLASIFVYPSFYEGFGFPPLEAMACGTPVITSFFSSLPEVVGDAAIMIDPYNLPSLTEAMKDILTDKVLANQLRQKGLERVKKFSWEKAAKEYLKIFGSLK